MSVSKTIGVISGINECVNLFQWVRSAISSLHSQWSGTQEQKLQGVVLQLQSDLQCLGDTLTGMYDLIDRAEWRSHERCVSELLPKLKDAVYDAEDLLDEFRWYEMKISADPNATHLSPFIDFFHSVSHGSYNKITDILKRLNILSSQLGNMGLNNHATPRFDKSIRPETTSFPTESKIFGRQKELNEVISLLGVSLNSSTACFRKRISEFVTSAGNQSSIDLKRRKHNEVSIDTNKHKCNEVSTALHVEKTLFAKNMVKSNHVSTDLKEKKSGHICNKHDNNEETIESVPVLPIIGIGGVGKTTLAQTICCHPQVKAYFDLIIWTCVSDDFDVKRLTKEAIQSSSGREAMTDHLDSLQHSLAKNVHKKRFLLILDDMWDDALKENGLRWKRFCTPFKGALQGSMMLVTTRSQRVADQVRTMDTFSLEGLKHDIFWDFFKLCAFGFDKSINNPELDCIGRSILPKLKGSPLAAKTLGRLLRMSLDTTHWGNILKSELWELGQEETDILPALRLSYIYLPPHLKRCFSFCAMFPKDHKFEKCSLAELWVAEGFVAPQGSIPLQDIACQFFEDLVNRSFFQEFRDTYVMHDLMHDMAQLVSKDESFIIEHSCDIQKVPQNVRHLSILSSIDVESSNLKSLSKHRKLRTLFCHKSLKTNITASMMEHWCSKLKLMRVLSFNSTWELPNSIGNMKHLRYLEISGDCQFKSFPSAYCCLYNLQMFYARKCNFESLPSEFGNLINLEIFESHILQYYQGQRMEPDATVVVGSEKKFGLTKNLDQFHGHLVMRNLGEISKFQAAKAKLKDKYYINSLTLQWSRSSPEHSEMEVLQAVHPPKDLKSLTIWDYPGEYLPSWFHPQKLPNSTTPLLCCYSDGIRSMPFSIISRFVEQKRLHVNDSDRTCGIFSSLTTLAIEGCQNLLSLEEFLQPGYMPAIKKIKFADCRRLVSLPTARLGDLHHLEELVVTHCPKIDSRGLFVPSLKKLRLTESGNLEDDINCCSLTYLYLSCSHLKSIQLQMWSLPSLLELTIAECESLTFVGEFEGPSFTNFSNHEARSSRIRTFPSLTGLIISYCSKLQTLDGLLTQEYIPAIQKIRVSCCEQLQSLPGERFEDFPLLKCLDIWRCQRLNWQRGMVLSASLQSLSLQCCGDFSAWFPSCLENLTCLKSLTMISCEHIESIPGHLWSSNLASLKEVRFEACPDLVSIGGSSIVKNITKVLIDKCPKLKGLKQPLRRGEFLIS